MSSGAVLHWALTGVFAVCAALYLAPACAGGAWKTRVGSSLHALMPPAMIAMFWSWGMVLAPIVDVLVFTAGVLYFAYLGLFTTRVAHAASVMMGSMVLMASA